MPPIFDKPTTDKYDYVVIGGGSGGSATAVSVVFNRLLGVSQSISPIGSVNRPVTDPKSPFGFITDPHIHLLFLKPGMTIIMVLF